MQADDLHISPWRTGPAEAARTASPAARPRRSPGGAGQSFFGRPRRRPDCPDQQTRRTAAPGCRGAGEPGEDPGPDRGIATLGGWGVGGLCDLVLPSQFRPARTRGPSTGRLPLPGRRHPSPGFNHDPASSVRHSSVPALELGQHSDTDLASVTRARAESFNTERPALSPLRIRSAGG